jgi:pimeloyl-ACP methyl ester carboxylesterase
MAAACLAVGTTGCGEEPAASTCPDGGCSVESVDDIAYAEDAVLGVHAPTDSGPWPVIVLAHGKGGGTSSTALLADAIAAEGAVVYDPTLPDEPPFLATTEHLACAVRFARSTAAGHGGDAERVTIVGHSMGAYTGSLVALAGDDYDDDGCVTDGGSAVADALVGYEGPYDHALNPEYPFDLPALERADHDVWTAVNPYEHVGGNPDLIVRLIQGVDDDVSPFDVHPRTAEDFDRTLADAGYDVELELIEGAGHSYGTPGLPQWEAIVERTMEVA